ncbi:MAG: hypothetical protein AAB459_04595 [Patescibacteria group bacterium]
MSERIPKSHEQLPQHHKQIEMENIKIPESDSINSVEVINQPAKHIEQIRSTAQKEAISGKERSIIEKHTDSNSGQKINRQSKKLAYQKTLHRAQTHLNRRERAFSRILHKPFVEKVSNIGAQSIARSSGLLAGSFVACVGTIILIWASRRYGITYSYFALFGLFLGGYFFGIIIEVAWLVFRYWGRKY